MADRVERMTVRYDRPRRIYILRAAFRVGPAVFARRAHQRVAAEQVRACDRVLFVDEHRTLGAVKLHARQLAVPDVKAARQRHLRARVKLENSVDVRVHIDRQHRSLCRAGRHGARLRGTGRHRADPAHRAQQAEQRGHIIRSHVVKRACARLIEERGGRVMELVAVTDEPRAAARDPAEPAAVDQLTDVLKAAAEEGIRGAADEQALFLRELDQLFALRERHGEGLFRVDMLAGLERGEVVLIVRLRRGQVEHEVDVRVRDQLHARRIGLRDAVLRGLALRLFQTARRARHDLHRIIFFQIVQIYIADVTDADDADTKLFHCFSLHTAACGCLAVSIIIDKRRAVFHFLAKCRTFLFPETADEPSCGGSVLGGNAARSRFFSASLSKSIHPLILSVAGC